MISKIKLNDYDTEQTSNMYLLASKLNEVIEELNKQNLKIRSEGSEITRTANDCNCPEWMDSPDCSRMCESQ